MKSFAPPEKKKKKPNINTVLITSSLYFEESDRGKKQQLTVGQIYAKLVIDTRPNHKTKFSINHSKCQSFQN